MAERTRITWLIVVVASAACAAILLLVFRADSVELPEGIDPVEYRLAANRFIRRFDREPDRDDTLMMLAEVASTSGRSELALAAFDEIGTDHPVYGSAVKLQRGILKLKQHDAVAAEQDLRAFLSLADATPQPRASQIAAAESWLSYLLSVQLRLDERNLILQRAHEHQRATLADSKQYFFPRLLIWKSDTGWEVLKSQLANAPQDVLLNASQARYLIGAGELRQAAQLITTLNSQFAEHPQVVVANLEMLYEQDNWLGIEAALQQYPSGDETGQTPFVIRWLRGELALRNQDWSMAVASFQRALDRDPTNPTVHMGLAKAYRQLAADDQAETIRQRAQGLAKIRVRMERVHEDSPAEIRWLIENCRQLGFDAAADAFTTHLQRLQSSAHFPPESSPPGSIAD